MKKRCFLSQTTSANQGFTLVELLLAMSLTILMGGVIYLLQSSGLRTVTKGTAKLTLHSDVRRKMEVLLQDLRCTNEVLEVSPDTLKLRVFQATEEEDVIGDAALVTIVYGIERDTRRCRIFRTEGNLSPILLIELDSLEEPLFIPLYETYDANSADGSQFEFFDMRESDSGKRERISFMRIRFVGKRGAETTTIMTGVLLRPAHSRLLQPHWNFR